MPDFDRDDRLDLPYGVRLRSTGVSGTAGEVGRAPTAGTPVRDAEPGTLAGALAAAGLPDGAAAVLGTAAEEAGLRRELTLPVSDLVTAPGAGDPTRGDDDLPHLELAVPAPAADEGQVVLEIDGSGLLRWHTSTDAGNAAGTDRSGGEQVFRVPVEQAELDGDAADRGLAGLGLAKVIQVLRYPIQAVAGKAGELAVGAWERSKRPYGLHRLGPDGTATPAGFGGTAGAVGFADGPHLLLVHGTFSTAASAFHGLHADLPELVRRYDGRVLAFDHPSLHADPAANVAWLLDRLPAGLVVDVVAHSRGGLVARHLAAAGPIDVRTLVHVATPNDGTVLASSGRWSTLLDVFTNLLTLVPDGPVTTTVQAVVEVVKQLGTGVLGGLDGLAAMDPAGDALRQLNAVAAPAGVHAVASDFRPTSGPAGIRALDLLVDRFFGAGNDLVVPTGGVSAAGAYRIADPYVVPVDVAVSHTRFFADPAVRTHLLGLLPTG